MPEIQPTLLSDTLSLIQLAREAALAQGRQAQADNLAPVVKNLRVIVTRTNEQNPPAEPGGILAQNDFQTLLNAVRASTAATAPDSTGSGQAAALEKHPIIRAMAASNMSEVDIARQMGMTREEVRMVLALEQRKQAPRIGGWE